jgi:hypothetical protein
MPERKLVGVSITDTRACGPTCTCEPDGCTGATFEAFGAAGCETLKKLGNVDGQCVPGGETLTVASYRYNAGNGCKVGTAPAVTGTVTAASPRTVCCTFGF